MNRAAMSAGVAALLFGAGLAAATAQEVDPHALVAAMSRNELLSQRTVRYWIYQQTNANGGKVEVKKVLETPECWLSWPLSYDGNPATPEQRQHAQAEIDRLVNNPQARQKNREAINQDSRKAETLVKTIPQMFLFKLTGEHEGNYQLEFRPNPNFRPSSREAKVFHDMAGTLEIDRKEKRLASINGHLLTDVRFGGGVLATLYKDGTFHVEQKEIAPDDWELTLLDVHISGHALFFKTISEQQHQVNTDFRPLPANVSLAQAANLLEQGDSAAAASPRGQP